MRSSTLVALVTLVTITGCALDAPRTAGADLPARVDDTPPHDVANADTSAPPDEGGGGDVPMFVAVGYAGRRALSFDGTTWPTSVTEPGPGGDDDQLLRTVVYGKGVFVAGGGSAAGRVMSTRDGAAWTELDYPDRHAFNVGFGDGRFIALAGDLLLTSDDGLAWDEQPASPGFSSNARHMCFGLHRFVAVGDAHLLASSPDGLTWVEAGARRDDGQDYQRCAFAAGRFVAVGNKGALATSTDGVAWTETRVTPPSAGEVDLSGVAFGGGQFIVTASSQEGGRVLSTTDGVALEDLTAEATGDLPSDVAFAGGRFAGVQWEDQRMSSADGVHWEATVSDGGHAFAAIVGRGDEP